MLSVVDPGLAAHPCIELLHAFVSPQFEFAFHQGDDLSVVPLGRVNVLPSPLESFLKIVHVVVGQEAVQVRLTVLFVPRRGLPEAFVSLIALLAGLIEAFLSGADILSFHVCVRPSSGEDRPMRPVHRLTIDGLLAGEILLPDPQWSRPTVLLIKKIEHWLADAEGTIRMRAERAKLSRHNAVAKAIDYMLTRWPAFTRFLEDGRICLTNNAAERALRGLALGRKSWLFAGSERGAERAAIMYTLIQTAKLNDVDPQAWLAHTLSKIADTSQSRLSELLP
jgi:transposase